MSRRPNFLIIMTDQHSPDVSGFGGDQVVDSANLDSLARKSIRFTNAVTPSPVCTPARMCMLTGKEAYNCSAWQNHWVLFPEHKTWPDYFSENGYRTSLIGKMHFGGKNQMHGFQKRPYGDLKHGLGHQGEPLDIFPAYGGAQSAGVSEIPESLNVDQVTTREALSCLLEQNYHEPETPWFSVVSYSRPHPPFTAPGRYIGKYRDRCPMPPDYPADFEGLEPYARDLAEINKFADLSEEQVRRGIEGYYACVDFVDDCIGELLHGLEEAGMLENTYVIYTADHGEMLGSHGLWAKAVYFENAIRIPMLISGPGISGQIEVDQAISLVDLFPTACSLAGLPIAESIDGKDFSALLSAPHPEKAPAPRDYCYSMFIKYGTRIKGGNLAKYSGGALAPCAAMRCIRGKEWKYVDIEEGKPLLFHLTDDPGEEVNLAGKPQYADREKSMRGELAGTISWEEIHKRLAKDRKRIPDFLSGQKPTTPNQYMLPDGRIFDAEKELYDARWINFDPEDARGGGIIPQMFG